LALDHYLAVTTAGESAGVEQLFAEDFNQKFQASNAESHGRSEIVKFLKKQKGEKRARVTAGKYRNQSIRTNNI
jgi:hypothetical protein